MENNLLHKAASSLKEWLQYHFFTRKMTTPLGIALLGFIGIAVSYVTVMINYHLSIGLVAAAGVVLLCLFCIAYPLFGFYSTYLVSVLMMFPERLLNTSTPIPTGLIPEYLAYLALLGVLTQQQYRKEITSKFWSHAITTWMIVLLLYYTLEIINPSMGNKFGWFNYFRKQVSFAAFFYMSYCILNSRKAVRWFTGFWIVVTTIEALYACKQQWFGFSGFEEAWLLADPKRYALFVNFGFVRRFGLLSDPAAAGILYSCSAVMMLVLALRATKMRKQLLYLVLTVVHLLASVYTGTRTGTMMIVAGIVFYCVLTLYEKRTLIFSGAFVFMLVGLLVAPVYDNMFINRLRSTFEGSKDPSAMVRDINRKMVQPYVYNHPIGGGINTCGLMGALYNPGHFLSTFPPDSGYMLIMVEQGFIGLALMVAFYFIILRTGIRYFYRVRDPELKTLYLVHLIPVFTLMVAQYSQGAIGQYPSVLYFYSVLAMFLKLHQYDNEKLSSNN